MKSAWTEDLPSDWENRRFSWLGRLVGGGTPARDDPSYWDGEIPWVSPKDMKSRIIQDTEDHISDRAIRESATRLVPTGTLLLVTRSGILRHSLPVGITARPMALNQDLKGLVPAEDVDATYLAYWIDAHQSRLLSIWRKEGTTVESLETGLVKHTSVPMPPFGIQRAIASFLDRQTEKIDTLIEKKGRLLGLLEERRTALITRAVTKGLDPDVPMKVSGVEWIGEIPEHWEVTKIGLRFSVQLGKMLDQSQISGDYLFPYVRVADVQWGEINVDDLPRMDFSPSDQARYRLEEGDLLVNEGGSYVGRSAIWRGQRDPCFYQKALHRVRPRSGRDSTRFLYYVMRFATEQGVFVAGGNQTTIDHLTAEQLRAYRFAFPPLREQEEVADYLDEFTSHLSRTTASIHNAIDLLQEYRTALISAAVTGKIDVRDKVPA